MLTPWILFHCQTAVPCYNVSAFSCNLVVTMRPVPESKLEAAVLATSALKEAHGAPIHMGDPGQRFSFFTLHALHCVQK